MKSPERIFLSDRLASVEDVDAALSNAADDYHGLATEYIARLDPNFYVEFVKPEVQRHSEIWDAVVLRLKGTRLILLPALPSADSIRATPALADTIALPLFQLSASEDGKAKWITLTSQEVASIRSLDLARIVENNVGRSILTLPPGHFELPSGAHTSHFLRLAECLADIETIDRLVYWISRDLCSRRIKGEPRRIAVLVDNPSTLILAVRLVQVLPQNEVTCLCLPEYPETQDAAREMSLWLEARIPASCEQLLAVISVSSTGSLRKLIATACDRIGVSASFSVLYSTINSPEQQAYCDLEIEGYKHFSTQHECSLCAPPTQGLVLKIDRARYFIHERKVKTIPLPIKKFFSKQAPFLKKYGTNNLSLLTHVDDPNDANPRHHAFYVSVTELMKDPGFRDEFLEKIRAISPPPDLVVIPPHPAGVVIGHFISQEFGITVVTHSDLRLNFSVDADKTSAALITKANSLLIVDDLAFTGGRLKAYSRSVREANGKFAAPKNIHFFPLLVLSENKREWDKTVRGIEVNHPGIMRKVISMYELQLPDWGKEKCPWCAEQQELEKIPAFSEDDSDAQGSRLLVTPGIVGDQWANVLATTNIPAFGDSSPILPGGSNATQVLFACASALQQARTTEPEEDQLNPNTFPISVLLDVSVMRDFQNEFLLNVSLLRSLTRNELSDPLKNHLRAVTLDIGTGKRAHDRWALRELLLAEKRGLIPRIVDAKQRREVYEAAGFLSYYSDP